MNTPSITDHVAMLVDLREAAVTLRRYEISHRAKNTDESSLKAELNAALAARFEATIAKAELSQSAAPVVPASASIATHVAMLLDLREAAVTLRRYEISHRAKNTDESSLKAELNAALAARFEATIAKAELSQSAAPVVPASAIIATIVRDMCDSDRPDKHDTDTVEIRLSDLIVILGRHVRAQQPSDVESSKPHSRFGGQEIQSMILERLAQSPNSFPPLDARPMTAGQNHHAWLERVAMFAATVSQHPDIGDGVASISKPMLELARAVEAEADQLRSLLSKPEIDVAPVDLPSVLVKSEVIDGDIGHRTGFMCLIDFEVELGEDSMGTPIYPDERSLRAGHQCVDSCGMAEVMITLAKSHPPTAPQKYYTFTEAEIEASARKRKSAKSKPMPVAWQERQQKSKTDWTDWYDCSATVPVRRGSELSAVLDGVKYEWRPLFAGAAPVSPSDKIDAPMKVQ